MELLAGYSSGEEGGNEDNSMGNVEIDLDANLFADFGFENEENNEKIVKSKKYFATFDEAAATIIADQKAQGYVVYHDGFDKVKKRLKIKCQSKGLYNSSAKKKKGTTSVTCGCSFKVNIYEYSSGEIAALLMI